MREDRRRFHERTPKNARRDIIRAVAGASVEVAPAVADAFFLVNHPGWTYDDLHAAPADVIAMIRLIDEQTVRMTRG